MTDLRSAAQQALEALEFMADEWGFTQKANRPERWQAIEALRAALEQPEQATGKESLQVEQPEQEPVAWMTPGQDLHLNNGEGFRFSDWTPLFTHPPRREWRGLTEEETNLVCKKARDDAEAGWPHGPSYVERVICGIDAELKERNA